VSLLAIFSVLGKRFDFSIVDRMLLQCFLMFVLIVYGCN